MFEFRVDENIKLMLPLPHHAEEIAAIVRENLLYLQEWQTWAVDDYSVENGRFYVKDSLQRLAAGTGFATSIVYQNQIAGQIGFHDIEQTNQSAKIGYWIAAKMQGSGIVTKCCRALTDYAFKELGLNRIQIDCDVRNIKSRAIPERLGFRLEGICRQAKFENNRFTDWAIYAMLKEEWKNI